MLSSPIIDFLRYVMFRLGREVFIRARLEYLPMWLKEISYSIDSLTETRNIDFKSPIFHSFLWINGDRLPVSFVGFDCLCFCRGKIIISTSFSFTHPSNPPFLILPLFPILCTLFSTTCARPPTPNGILLALYYRYGRYGGGSWERQRWTRKIPSFPLPLQEARKGKI